MYLDAFAAQASLEGDERIISVNWDAWKGLGMDKKAREVFEKYAGGKKLFGGFTASEGVKIFHYLKNFSHYQVAVSSVDLQQRIEYRLSDETVTNMSGGSPNRKTLIKRPQLRTVYEPPRNEIEEKLTTLWVEFFAFEKLGIDDNFYEIGGDSLSATIITAKILKEFNAKISLREFLQDPTIRNVSSLIHASQKIEFSYIPEAKKSDRYPLLPAQRRLFFIQRADPSLIAYNETEIFQLIGEIDILKLEKDLQRIVDRHESLRTTFTLIDGNEAQLIKDKFILKLEVVNGQDDEEFIRNFIRPFNLEEECPIRVGLLKKTGNEALLIIDLHHIIADGYSHQLLLNDFIQIYKGATPASVKTQPKDYAVWCLESQNMEEQQKQANYWKEQFKDGIEPLQLPMDFQHLPVQQFEGDSVKIKLEKSIVDQIKRIVKDNGTNEYMLLLAAYSIFLSKIANQRNIIIGTPVSGRTHESLENAIGMFVNTLPLCNVVDPHMSFKDFLIKVKDNTLLSIENQNYQFDNIVKDLNIQREPGRNPLFDAAYIFESEPFSEVLLGDLKIKPYPKKRLVSKFDLALYSTAGEKNAIDIEFCFKTSLFKKSTIQQFLRGFETLINDISLNPNTLIKDLSIITETERAKILTEFNELPSNKVIEGSLTDLFQEQLLRTPDKKAVEYKGTSYSFKQLFDEATHVASCLKRKGITKGSVVAIITDRSPEMIIFKLASVGP